MSWIDTLRRISGVSRISRQLHARPARTYVSPYFQPTTEISLIATATFFSIILAFVAGYFLAVFRQYIISYLLIVILPLTALALWSVPDIRGMKNYALRASFLMTSAALIIWPSYLAFTVPGLPWMSLSRFLLFLSCIIFVISISLTKENRDTIGAILRHHTSIRYFLIAFLMIQIATIPLSSEITQSTKLVFNNIIYWILVFFISLVIFMEEKAVIRWTQLLFISTLVLCLITIREMHVGGTPWAGHIPSFLQIDDPVVERILAGRFRGGEFRAKATYANSLSYAEFLALVIPFALSWMVNARSIIMRFSFAAFIVFIIWAIVMTGSRLGMVGLAVGVLGYALLWGLRRRNLRRADLLGPMVVMLYPALLMLFSVAVLTIGRLRVMFIGGGEHQASNAARGVMMDRGIPMILENPIGHGAGQSGGVLGYVGAGGQITVDNYFLTIGLDYGIIGLISFFGLILVATYIGIKIYLTSRGSDAEYAGTAALSLGAYFVIKTVLSQTQNQSLMFMLVAMVLAISYRHGRIDAQSAPRAPEPQA